MQMEMNHRKNEDLWRNMFQMAEKGDVAKVSEWVEGDFDFMLVTSEE